jgi:hypothetical protein
MHAQACALLLAQSHSLTHLMENEKVLLGDSPTRDVGAEPSFGTYTVRATDAAARGGSKRCA